jgi:hypothetical protein
VLPWAELWNAFGVKKSTFDTGSELLGIISSPLDGLINYLLGKAGLSNSGGRAKMARRFKYVIP